MPVVWLATGPGPRARRQHDEFEQDVAYRSNWQDFLTAKFAIQYIGSWHSHHKLGLNRPSGGDVEAVRQYARRHGRHRNIEIIATLDGENGAPVLYPYVYLDAENGQHDLWNLNILPGASPLRAQIGQDRPGFSLDSRNSSTFDTSRQTAGAQYRAPQVDLPALASSPEVQNELRSLVDAGVDPEDIDLDERGGRLLLMFRLDSRVPEYELAAVIAPGTPPCLIKVDVLRDAISVRGDLSAVLLGQGVDLERQPFGGGVLAKVLVILGHKLTIGEHANG